MGTRQARRRSVKAAIACGSGVALLAGCGVTGAFHTVARREVLQEILPASVQVLLERDGRRFRSGSGVAVAARPAERETAATDCYVLTSGHILAGPADGDQVQVLLGRHRGKGTRARATVLATRDADGIDLALLRVATDTCAVARLGEPPALGEEIWVVAFPWGRHMTLTSGIVSQVNDAAGDLPRAGEGAPRLMVDASVSYGASGGGVYEAETGRLVGLVDGYRTARVSFSVDAHPAHIDVPVPGETYVTPLAQIRRFLTEAGFAGLLGPGTTEVGAAGGARPALARSAR